MNVDMYLIVKGGRGNYMNELMKYFKLRNYFIVGGKLILREDNTKKEDIRIIKDISTELLRTKITNKFCEEMLDWMNQLDIEEVAYSSTRLMFNITYHTKVIRNSKSSSKYEELNDSYLIEFIKVILTEFSKCCMEDCSSPAAYGDTLCQQHRKDVESGNLPTYIHSRCCVAKGCRNHANSSYGFCIDHAVELLNSNSNSRKRYITYMRDGLYRDGIISKCKGCRLVMNSSVCIGCGRPAIISKNANELIELKSYPLDNYSDLYEVKIKLNTKRKELGEDMYYEDMFSPEPITFDQYYTEFDDTGDIGDEILSENISNINCFTKLK